MLILFLTLLSAIPGARGLTLEEAIKRCPVPYEIMWAIAKVESGGYPFVIRVNENVRVRAPWLKPLGNGAYDCKNYRLCVYTARELIRRGIKNVDLGAFQINYLYHRVSPEVAFSVPESYLKACSILLEKVKENGWSWEGIASYHSKNPKRNREYAIKLYKVLQGLQ